MTNSNEDLPFEDLSEDLREHLQRHVKPDAYCYHCGQPADQHHPVGPIVIRISTPDEDDPPHEFCNWVCLGEWAARCAGGVLVIDRS